MSVNKNQKTNTGRSFAQFEAFALENAEKGSVKGGTQEQVDDNGAIVVVVTQ